MNQCRCILTMKTGNDISDRFSVYRNHTNKQISSLNKNLAINGTVTKVIMLLIHVNSSNTLVDPQHSFFCLGANMIKLENISSKWAPPLHPSRLTTGVLGTRKPANAAYLLLLCWTSPVTVPYLPRYCRAPPLPF